MKTQQPFNYKDVKVGSVYFENYYFLVVKIIKDDNGFMFTIWIFVDSCDYLLDFQTALALQEKSSNET
jgi:hypothetical protein